MRILLVALALVVVVLALVVTLATRERRSTRPRWITAPSVQEEARVMGPRLARIVDDIGRSLRAGETTGDVERRLASAITAEGWTLAMKGYSGFPASCAISVNEEILHGIPGARPLRDGDLVKIQVTARGRKTFAAVGWTFPVGSIDEDARRLHSAGVEALRDAIAVARPGVRVGTLGAAIQGRIEASGFSVVRDYVGYTMGELQLAEPQLPGFGRDGTGRRLNEPLILNLHVIAKQGGFEVEQSSDEWTVVAAPRERSVLFTAMVLLEGGDGVVLTPMEALAPR